ncbi:hypothetical protein [Photorhabdus heterorhabditis]|uniref:hypothetical protein n=1 Tax=Photorhabdus heterorhabditis TaxID=880156 RepID=UPI0006C8395F|nr:hypothetical protein [Photorhabdus heterorhabditis]
MKVKLKNLLKKWFSTIHPLPAKRLARWEKELLTAPPDIKDAETMRPFIKLELIETDLLEAPEPRDIRSFVTELTQEGKIITGFPCATVVSLRLKNWLL